MKKFFYVITLAFAIGFMCAYISTPTTRTLSVPSNSGSYIVSFSGDKLSVAELNIIRERFSDITQRNLSAKETRKTLQKVFTKELGRSALTLKYVSKSETNGIQSSSEVSHNWTLLQWCGYIIIAVLLFCITKRVIKHRLLNRSSQKINTELDPGD